MTKRRFLGALFVMIIAWGASASNALSAEPNGRATNTDAIAEADAGAPSTPSSPSSREALEGAKLDALLAEIAKARKPIQSLRADFVQERKLSLLATSVKSTGELAFVAPDRLRWELAAPDDVVYLVGPEGLSYRTRSSRATMPPSSANVSKGLADLRALLAGDLGLLRERYVLSASRGPSDVEISGVAKDKAASVRGFTLVLDKTLTLPLRARLLEGKRDSIDITFSNPRLNVPIDPKSMRP